MRRPFLILACILFSNLFFSQVKIDLFDIARKGNTDQIEKLFKDNPKSILALNSDGFSALILACYSGNIEVANFLINNGADINGNSKMGTPLMAAVVKGNVQIVKLLLKKNVFLNALDINGKTALIYATMFKNYQIVNDLVKAGANINLKDNRKNGAIEYAILSNDDKLIGILKENK